GKFQPFDDVEGFEQRQLLTDVQIRGVAGGVGEGARMRDGAHERTDPAIVAAKLENFLDHGAILTLEVAGRAGWGRDVRTLVDGYAQDAIRVGVRRARHGPVER